MKCRLCMLQKPSQTVHTTLTSPNYSGNTVKISRPSWLLTTKLKLEI